MKTITGFLVAIFLGARLMAGQTQDTFSEAEVFRALSWGMPDSEARRLARHLSDDPAVAESIPELKALGPTAFMYSEELLLLLSLVSEETRVKAERHLAEQRLRPQLTPQERATWEARRSQLREQLVQAGKIAPDP